MQPEPSCDSNEAGCWSVLVAEDDPALRALLSQHLERLGYRVDAVEDGIAALRLFEMRRYDIIFMDVQMPLMNGLQATAAIRFHEGQLRSNPTPIIATTFGGVSKEVGSVIGMSDYIEKPIETAKLDSVLRKWLAGSVSNELEGIYHSS